MLAATSGPEFQIFANVIKFAKVLTDFRKFYVDFRGRYFHNYNPNRLLVAS
jgi:hypothetical protein